MSEPMDVDVPPAPVPSAKPVNAMAALMAGAKAKGKEKASSEADAAAAAAAAKEGLPWVEKYRPETLEDVVSHQDITATRKCDQVGPSTTVGRN